MPRLGYKAPAGKSFGDLEIYGLDEQKYANSVNAKTFDSKLIKAEGAIDGGTEMSKGTYSKKGSDDPIDNAPDFITRHEKQMGSAGKGATTEGNHGKQG